jgi:hypothetical protein
VTSWRTAWQRALWSGSTASLLSAAVLALCGKLENDAAAGPLNGPSQWIWGERAGHRRGPTWRHTAVGYAIHHAASLGWATLHEKHVARLAEGRAPSVRVAAAALTAIFACWADFRIARGRLQPGFEKQLSRPSLLLVYSAFALGLVLWSPSKGIHAEKGTRRAAPSARTARAMLSTSTPP